MSSLLNTHSTGPTLNAASTAQTVITLPFTSGYTRIYNKTGVDLYYDVVGGTLSTTDSAVLVNADTATFTDGIRISALSLTTTSTGAGGVKAVVTAIEPTGAVG